MKKITLLLACLLSFASLPSFAVDQSDPFLLTEATLSNAFQEIKDKQVAIEADSEVLLGIVNREIMPYVNHQYASLYTMGSHFKKVTKEERKQYADAFYGYMSRQLAHIFAFYKGQKVTFLKSNKKSDKVRAITILIEEQGRPDIKLQLKLRINKRTREWSAYDLVAEGISMIQSKRSEFARPLRQNGVNAMTKKLIELNNKPFVIKRD